MIGGDHHLPDQRLRQHDPAMRGPQPGETGSGPVERRCDACHIVGDCHHHLAERSAGLEQLCQPRDHQRLDVMRGNAPRLGAACHDLRSMRDEVAIALARLDRMAGRHASAKPVADDACKQARGAGVATLAPFDPLVRDARLDRVPERLIDDRGMLGRTCAGI